MAFGDAQPPAASAASISTAGRSMRAIKGKRSSGGGKAGNFGHGGNCLLDVLVVGKVAGRESHGTLLRDRFFVFVDQGRAMQPGAHADMVVAVEHLARLIRRQVTDIDG